MTKRFFPLCSRQLIKWRCLTALYSLPLWPFLSGTPGIHCSDDNVAMSTSCRYINQAFESRKLEYLTRTERPLLMDARERTLAVRTIVYRLVHDKLIRSTNAVMPFSFHRINLQDSRGQLYSRVVARAPQGEIRETEKWPKFLNDRYRANRRDSLVGSWRFWKSYTANVGIRRSFQSVPPTSFPLYGSLSKTMRT